MSTAAGSDLFWSWGRLDSLPGPETLVFGRMYEDCSIELRAFRPGGRVVCIASAGCTALQLSQSHETVAVDINSVQLAYVAARLSGGRVSRGAAERRLAFARAFAALAGWRRARVREFLDLGDPREQITFWRRHLDTKRFRAATDLAFSRRILGLVYSRPLLAALPPGFGKIMRRRMERGFARHANRVNPYARGLLLGELPEPAGPSADPRRVRFIHADVAAFLESEPAGIYDGFSLSNVLDTASDAYRRRLAAAVRRTATPGAVAVVRSFAEPANESTENLAGEDRAMLWGIVKVTPAAEL
jgi:S-adenosylmethionine:diacylglycerol 3-amino-3-carboxypropyl transferase